MIKQIQAKFTTNAIIKSNFNIPPWDIEKYIKHKIDEIYKQTNKLDQSDEFSVQKKYKNHTNWTTLNRKD